MRVYAAPMAQNSPRRLNVTLDDAHAGKLSRLAERTHLQEGTLARSLLSQAIDAAEPDAEHVVALLDGIPDGFERARQGSEQIRSGQSVPLEEL